MQLRTRWFSISIWNWKKGSARQRGLVPFTGATVIKTRITLADASGRTVFQREVVGTKRTKGESPDVANSLCKHVRKAVEKTPEMQSKKLRCGRRRTAHGEEPLGYHAL